MSLTKISLSEYYKIAKVESFNTTQHICTTWLYNKKYKVNNLLVLPNIQKLWAKTRDEAIKNSYHQYCKIIDFTNKNNGGK